MADSLRYYIAHNGGLKIMQAQGGSLTTVGEFFEGKTLEYLTGSRKQPEIVFAAVAFDGGYRTNDGGHSWKKIFDGDVRTFTIDPHEERVVYMGIGPIRLFRSEDGGMTFEPIDSMLEFAEDVKQKWDVPPRLRGIEFPHVRHIFIHPEDHKLLFVLLEHGGVLYSGDGGETWKTAATASPIPTCTSSRAIPAARINTMFHRRGDFSAVMTVASTGAGSRTACPGHTPSCTVTRMSGNFYPVDRRA
jgi:hypothetical protein